MELYYDLLDWLANYAIIIASTISLTLTILTYFNNLNSTIKKIILFVSILTVLLTIPYYIILFYYPFVLLPTFGIFLTLYLIKTKKRVPDSSIFIYIINCIMYGFAIELSKANFNSWGSGTIFVGVYMVALTLPLFHLLRLLWQQDNTYGFFKLSTGLILLFIIWKSNFPPEYDLRDSNETLNLIRNSILYSVSVFTFEGILVLSRNIIKRLTIIHINRYIE